MEKIPMAAAFLKTKAISKSLGEDDELFDRVSPNDLIEFAKLHVQKALEEADKTISIQIGRCNECGGVDSLEQSILNVYPLDNIK